jgi:hypothetical protein
MKIYMHTIAAAQVERKAIGTFVQKPMSLHTALMAAVEDHDFRDGPFVTIAGAQEFVTCGVAGATTNPEDYVLREHRGEVAAYRRRDGLTAEEKRPDTVAAIIYNRQMYLNDPQTSDEAKADFVESGYTHCWVTTLAMKGPKAPVGPWRFCVNLAGGNAIAGVKTKEELVFEAQEIEDYWSKWSTVG